MTYTVYEEKATKKWLKGCFFLFLNKYDLGITKNYRSIILIAITADKDFIEKTSKSTPYIDIPVLFSKFKKDTNGTKVINLWNRS